MKPGSSYYVLAYMTPSGNREALHRVIIAARDAKAAFKLSKAYVYGQKGRFISLERYNA